MTENICVQYLQNFYSTKCYKKNKWHVNHQELDNYHNKFKKKKFLQTNEKKKDLK